MSELDRPNLSPRRLYSLPLFWVLIAFIALVVVLALVSVGARPSYVTTFDYRTSQTDLKPHGTFHTTDLVVDNTALIGGTENVGGNFSVNTNKFTANATTGAIVAAGTGSLGGALNMNTHLIDNVVNPVAAQDAATKNYVDTAVAGAGTVLGTANRVARFLAPTSVGNGSMTDDLITIVMSPSSQIQMNKQLFFPPTTSISPAIDMIRVDTTDTGSTATLFGELIDPTWSFDTTAAPLESVGLDARNGCTKSAGGNTLTCYGVVGDAYGTGDVNWAGWFEHGNVGIGFIGGGNLQVASGGIVNSGPLTSTGGNVDLGAAGTFSTTAEGSFTSKGTTSLGDAGHDASTGRDLTVGRNFTVTAGFAQITGALSVLGSGAVALFGSATDGTTYITSDQTIDYLYETNASGDGYINYYSFHGGTGQDRNLHIANGHGADIALFSAVGKTLAIIGALVTPVSRDSGTAPGLSAGCGTGALVSSGNSHFSITTAVPGLGTCVATFSIPLNSAIPTCTVTARNAIPVVYSANATTVTMSTGLVAAQTYDINCWDH